MKFLILILAFLINSPLFSEEYHFSVDTENCYDPDTEALEDMDISEENKELLLTTICELAGEDHDEQDIFLEQSDAFESKNEPKVTASLYYDKENSSEDSTTFKVKFGWKKEFSGDFVHQNFSYKNHYVTNNTDEVYDYLAKYDRTFSDSTALIFDTFFEKNSASDSDWENISTMGFAYDFLNNLNDVHESGITFGFSTSLGNKYVEYDNGHENSFVGKPEIYASYCWNFDEDAKSAICAKASETYVHNFDDSDDRRNRSVIELTTELKHYSIGLSYEHDRDTTRDQERTESINITIETSFEPLKFFTLH